MKLLVNMVQLARVRFDVYEQMAVEKSSMMNSWPRSAETVVENKCLTKELKMKKTSAQKRSLKLRHSWS